MTLKAPTRTDLAFAEPLIHQDQAGSWFIEWAGKQGVDLADKPFAAMTIAQACYPIFIDALNLLFELREEKKVGKHEFIRKRDILIRTVLGIDPSTLSDEEWASRSAEIDYLDTLRAGLPGMLR